MRLSTTVNTSSPEREREGERERERETEREREDIQTDRKNNPSKLNGNLSLTTPKTTANLEFIS